MTDLHSAALRAGVFQVVEREAKNAKEAAKAELSGLKFGDTVSGSVGDDLLCKVSWSKGSARVVVTDERAFVAWVKQHHPTEIVESVNPAYVKALTQAGGALVDANGEVAAGVEVQTGAPSLTVRSEKGALDLVTQLVADGRVTLDSIKEITAVPADISEAAEAADAEDADILDVEVV